MRHVARLAFFLCALLGCGGTAVIDAEGNEGGGGATPSESCVDKDCGAPCLVCDDTGCVDGQCGGDQCFPGSIICD